MGIKIPSLLLLDILRTVWYNINGSFPGYFSLYRLRPVAPRSVPAGRGAFLFVAKGFNQLSKKRRVNAAYALVNGSGRFLVVYMRS